MISPSLSDIMTRNVLTVRPSDSLQLVQRLMVRYQITRFVVVDKKQRAIGILTQKDLIRAISEDTTEREINEIPASEAMTKKLITVTPQTKVSSAAKTMLDKNISSLIVVDEEGKLEGIVTKTDLCRWYYQKCYGYFKVKDAVTRNVITVKPSASIFRVVDLMNKNAIHRVVVVENDEPVGVVTASDLTLTSTILKPSHVLRGKKPMMVKGTFIVSPAAVSSLTARDVMTADPLVLKEEDDLGEASRIMLAHRISGLPVVNAEGKLTGILTKTDIAKSVAKMD